MLLSRDYFWALRAYNTQHPVLNRKGKDLKVAKKNKTVISLLPFTGTETISLSACNLWMNTPTRWVRFKA